MDQLSKIEDSKLELPPQRLPSDVIQLVFLFVVLILGIPSNLITLHRLLIAHKGQRKCSSKASFLLLKMHLTVSDLMLLLFYAAPQLVWNITYEWKVGDSLCKLYNYVSMSSFYLSSNITICIAIERLRTVLSALRMRKGAQKCRSVLPLILPAWFLAFSLASPQLVVFEAVDVLPAENETWIQCSDVWTLRGISTSNDLPEWFLTDFTRLLYDVTHLLLVFWVPLLVLLASYGTIAMRLRQVSSMESLPQSHFNSRHVLLYDAKHRSMSMPDASKIEGGLRLAKRYSMSPTEIKKKLRSLSIVSGRSSGDVSEFCAQGGALWRRRIREKLFRSTLLIVIAHFLFWLPYNLSALLAQASDEYREMIAINAHFLNDLQVVITLVNPLLYAITE